MCSIVGSFSKTTFKELVKLNQSRGSFSYSFLVLNPADLSTVSLEQRFGVFNTESVDTAPDNMFYLGHTQAPTGGLIEDPNRIHPASLGNDFLFHNGIIKQKDVGRLQLEHASEDGWDSRLMLMEIQKKGLMETLNTIDGSFACVFNDRQKLRIFRSAAGTLFVDEALNISSTSFIGGSRIEKDSVYVVDLLNKNVIIEDTFKSKSSPYFY
jgi:hypothetical protein